jgi:hypothetical protein
MRAALLAVVTLSALLGGAACLSPDKPPPTSDLPITTIPWPTHEELPYNLLDRKSGDLKGSGTLSATLRGEGEYELQQSFTGDNATSDDLSVTVDSFTLKPLTFHRKQVLENQTSEVKGDYDAAAGVVNIIEIEDGNERPVPLRLGEHYYDNDTALFLWRTIPFAEAYTIAYRTVLTGSRTQVVLELKVLGKEQVTVPAGTLDAWKLQIRGGGVKQFAWFTDTPQHYMVQYMNPIYTFELTALP